LTLCISTGFVGTRVETTKNVHNLKERVRELGGDVAMDLPFSGP
jgi:hypothetical protein